MAGEELDHSYLSLKGEPDNDKDKRPWHRLAILVVSSAMLSGIGPGAPVWTSMLTAGGLFSHMCPANEPIPCDEQFIMMSMLFSVAGAMTTLMLLVAGLLFDKLGGRVLGTVGGALLILGYTLLLVSTAGAQMGLDSTTSYLFVPTIFILDCGSLCGSQAILAILFHFPDMANVVFSLLQATVAFAAVLPMVLEIITTKLGVSLELCLIAWIGGMVVATFGVWISCPSQEEYLEQAEKVLGRKLDMRNSSVCSTLYDANRLFRENWKDHALYLVFVFGGGTWAMIYTSVASDYAMKLFHDASAGAQLANVMVVSQTLTGVFIMPLVSYVSERFGMLWLMVLVAVFTIIAHEIILVDSWAAQIATCCIVSFNSGIQSLSFNLRAMAYSPPTKIGSVQATYGLYGVFVALISLFVAQGWIASLEDPDTRLQIAFRVLTTFSSVGFVVYCIVFSYFGLPSSPVLLPEEIEDICRAFGCKQFSEVAHILHREHEPYDNVVSNLTSADTDLHERLVMSINKERMRHHMSKMSIDSIEKGFKVGFAWRHNVFESAVGGLNMRALMKRLGNLSKFGKGAAKTLDQFQAEIAKGRSRLEMTGGQMQRIVDLVALRIYSNNTPSKLVLVQVAEVLADGRQRDKVQLPGTKRNQDQDDLQATILKICEKVGLDKVRTTFFLDEAKTVQTQLESPSYPGVFTLYNKTVVIGYVTEDNPEALQAIGLPSCEPFTTRSPSSGMSYSFEWMEVSNADRKLLAESEKPKAQEQGDVFDSRTSSKSLTATQEEPAETARSLKDIMRSLKARDITKQLLAFIVTNNTQGLEQWFLSEKVSNIQEAIRDLASWPKYNAQKVCDAILDMVAHENFFSMAKRREELKPVLVDFFMVDLARVQKDLTNSTEAKLCSKNHPWWPCSASEPWKCSTCARSYTDVDKMPRFRCGHCDIDICKMCQDGKSHTFVKSRMSVIMSSWTNSE